MTTPRLRPISYIIQPQFVVDDGDSLTPVPVQPITVSAADWPSVVVLMAQATEQLRQQVEAPAAPALQAVESSG